MPFQSFNVYTYMYVGTRVLIPFFYLFGVETLATETYPIALLTLVINDRYIHAL